jgi:hypothetical protein
VIWWLLFWLRSAGDVTPPPTPEPLPYLRRDGADVAALPAFTRRSA